MTSMCCVCVVMTYGTVTWSLTMGLIRRLKVAQREMEGSMPEVSLRDRISNEEIRRLIKAPTLPVEFPGLSCSRAHCCRRNGRWGQRVLEWLPCTGKWSVGRPYYVGRRPGVGNRWMQAAQDNRFCTPSN